MAPYIQMLLLHKLQSVFLKHNENHMQNQRCILALLYFYCVFRDLKLSCGMQDQRIILSEEVTNVKPQKKKQSSQMASAVKIKREATGGKETSNLSGKPQKGFKRGLKSDVSPPFQQTDRSGTDSSLDPSGSSDEYRALRRKYLLLEEESFSLDKELNEVDAEVKTLEDEKIALLDHLVVLEGLLDPSEIKHDGGSGKETK